MYRFACGACLALLLVSGNALANGSAIHPFFQSEWRRWVPSGNQRPGPFHLRAAPRHDLNNASLSINVDPQTGVTTGTAHYTFTSTGTGSSNVGVLVDQGLTLSEVSVTGDSTVTLSQQPYPPYTYAVMSFSPVVPVGEEVTLSFSYTGTLMCSVDPAYARPHRYCGTGDEMNFFMTSFFPYFFDPYGDYFSDDYVFDVTLEVPSGQQVIFSGDLLDSQDDGTTSRTTWQAEHFTSMMTPLAVVGDLATSVAAETTPPTTVYSLKSSPTWNDEMAGWMSTILPFIDAQAGATFPFTQLSVVKLPQLEGFDGTATNAVTLLGEHYASRGVEMFEETLLHENVHQWWGVIVYPMEPSLWLVEGMAMISEYDYAAAQFHAAEDRDLYLATRYRENELGLRYLTNPSTLPPLMLSNWSEMPGVLIDSTVWAYIKSSATLDYLRLSIGEDDFGKGLKDYRDKCAFVNCTTADFQQAMEAASGEDLQSFLDQFVYATNYPSVSVGFDQVVSAEGSKVTVSLSQVQDLTTPMELWFVLEDGTVSKQVVTLSGLSSTLTAELPGRVRAVKPNPRQDAILWSRSAQPGDVDMDGEVDGRDVIHCARLVGKTPTEAHSPESVLGTDMEFDPRCDLVDDQTIEDADLAAINDTFATVKAP